MLKLKELLRLKYECGLGHRAIGRAIKASASTVSYYSRAFAQSGLSWPLPKPLEDDQLKLQLEPYCQQLQTVVSKPTIDLPWVHQELKHKGVTLQLLWQEYQQRFSQSGYSYSEFCRQYRQFKKRLKLSLRQTYVWGEKCMVDYAGPKIPMNHQVKDKVTEAYLFIGVLCASNLTYVEAIPSRSLSDWLGAHSRMLSFFGGVPTLIIPDNEKAGVSQACPYDPELNPHYAAWAKHYGTIILPARPHQPRDKAKVETTVQIVERFILAKLRHQTFFNLKQLNEAISSLLKQLNEQPFKQLSGSRISQFQQYEQGTLKPLPQCEYEWADLGQALVSLDYHVKIDHHFYSVPHHLIGQTVHYRLTQNSVYCYHQNKQVAHHLRSRERAGTTTCWEHRSSGHRAHLSWSPQVFMQWGQAIGPASTQLAQYHVNTQPHPECCYRIYLGLKRLCQRFGQERFEQACVYALQHRVYRYLSLRSILHKQLDKQQNSPPQSFTPQIHPHLRGQQYYQTNLGE